ncbi:hypothetical protein MMC16_003477 [Acarospora aff. strigata]|nr:hypothetical protein [Acarospora aff. strigata]
MATSDQKRRRPYSGPPSELKHPDRPIDSIEQDADEFDLNDSLSGSGRHSSEADEVFFDKASRHSSPQTSHHSDDYMSELPSGSRKASCMPNSKPSSPYTPLYNRSPIRDPSSVRAMQMDTTPPPDFPSPNPLLQHKQARACRNSTPRSVRSQYGAVRTPSRLSPGKKVKKEYPLVLLHVTILPANIAYSTEVMDDVLPDYVLENWKLLREKVTDTVLERGILIPHPREDYDLLEERLLESLELKLPRILKCGHLHIDPEDAPTESEAEDDASDTDDADVCADCGRHIRDGRFGSTGAGERRWDIKIFAANGLMRAGAWGAAWREMERVDVEILPWMDDKMRRDLVVRQEEEDRLQDEDTGAVGGDEHVSSEKVGAARQEGGLDEQRRKEIYGDDAQAYVDGLFDHAPAKTSRPFSQNDTGRGADVPIFKLVQNYFILLARDRRNIAIFLLTLLVVFLANRPVSSLAVPSPPEAVARTPPIASAMDYVSAALIPSASSSVTMPGSDDDNAYMPTKSDDDEPNATIPAEEELREATQAEQV